MNNFALIPSLHPTYTERGSITLRLDCLFLSLLSSQTLVQSQNTGQDRLKTWEFLAMVT